MTSGSRGPVVSHPRARKPRWLPRECARGWRVTGPSPCPRNRADSPRIEADRARRVARDARSRAGLSRRGMPPSRWARRWRRRPCVGRGTRAVADARRRGTRGDRGRDGRARACGRATRGRRRYRPAGWWRRSAPDGTIPGTRCSDDEDGSRRSSRGATRRPTQGEGRGDRGGSRRGWAPTAPTRTWWVTPMSPTRMGGGPILASRGGSNLASVEGHSAGRRSPGPPYASGSCSTTTAPPRSKGRWPR